ncbi:unnamed protein product, partial [Mesorhabditis belari]|uniref:Band 4.1 domain-containing protein n=1 Tax=Mesorhabditis belari TaxID=2138241 RepID=A0AAF3J5Z5_9BILA
MDRPSSEDLGSKEPLLEIKRVGETKIVHGSGSRKISTELRLKASMEEQKDGQNDETMLPARPIEPGFVRESMSQKRGFQKPLEMIPDTPVAHVRTDPHPHHKTNSPISNTLYELNNVSSAGRSDSSEPIDICIYFPDQQGYQFSVENGRLAQADFLLELAVNQKNVKGAQVSVWNEAFALWMVSPLLEVQLKSYHPPYEVRRQWANFLKKYTNASTDEILNDEPMLMIRRNVTLPIEREKKICEDDKQALQVLFEDAHTQFIQGRYAFDNCRDAAEMAGLSLAAVLGGCPEHDLVKLRSELEEHLPERHLSSVRGPIVFGKALSGTKEMEDVVLRAWRKGGEDRYKAMNEYLAKARESPCYGAAFFAGSIERPNLSFGQFLKQSWFTSSNSDIKVRVSVNMETICVIDEGKGDLLLVQPIDDCSWSVIERKEPPEEDDEVEESSLLLHFPETNSDSGISSGEEAKRSVVERKFRKSRKNAAPKNGQETKLLQVFCYQAMMIDALLKTMKDLGKARSIQIGRHRSSSPEEGFSNESFEPSSSSSSEGGFHLRRAVGRQPSLTKGHRMCLATFDASGQCLKAQGSLKKVLTVK